MGLSPILKAINSDSLQLSESYAKALKNVLATTELMLSLGFVVHPDKSVFSPFTYF